jgi:Limiting CO2-inducible proteins B/C beta carbonyic anhydrases
VFRCSAVVAFLFERLATGIGLTQLSLPCRTALLLSYCSLFLTFFNARDAVRATVRVPRARACSHRRCEFRASNAAALSPLASHIHLSVMHVSFTVQAVAAVKEAVAKAEKKVANAADHLAMRMDQVTEHFPTATSIDDFLMRAEVSLCAHGIRGDNCIACTNLCRDESTGILKTKIDNIFGASFNINGLGACLTCGCLGAAPTCRAVSTVFVRMHFLLVALVIC